MDQAPLPNREFIMAEPLTVIPDANHALRADLFRFVQQQDVAMAERILWALQNSPVELFIRVTRKVGALGEPPITAADLSLMKLDDGRPIKMIMACTKLTPDNLDAALAERGVYFRPIGAKQLLEVCLERGIIGIELDGGLPTEVLIGPLGMDKPMGVHAHPDPTH